MIFSPTQQKNPILEFDKFLRGELHWLSFCVSLILKLAVILTVVVVLLVPIPVYADGGAPLLLLIPVYTLFNVVAFFYGVLLIIVVEWVLYVRLANIPAGEAFVDAFIANLVSTIVVGFGVPLVVVVVFTTLSFVMGDLALALGTWVWEGHPFPKFMWTPIVFWLIVTFVLTVQTEKAVLKKLWKARHYESQLSASTLSWRSNTVTYLGLVGLFIFIGGSQLFGNK